MRPLLALSVSSMALALALPALAEPDANDPGVATQLPPVTVVATRSETRVDEAPATVTVFTADQIERLLFTDIKDLVRYEPGVSVVSQPARFGAALGSTGRAGNEGFTIRGLGGDRVLIVVDGVRSPDGFVFGAQSVGRGGYSDLDLMRSVEILRGPASALYGSDGVAGAVSFTTKDPADLLTSGRDIAARGRVAYNSADASWTEGLALAGRAGAWSALLAYTRRDAQETETGGDNDIVGPLRTTANPQDIQSNAILGKIVWDVAPGHALRLTWDHYDSEVFADVLSGRTATVLNLTANDETTRDRVSLDWRGTDVFGLDRAHVAAYWQEAETRQFTFEDRTPAVDRTRDNTFDNRVYGVAADGRTTANLGGVAHRLTFGGDWSETRQQGIRDGTVPPFGETFPTSPFPITDYTLAGVFVQDEISLLDDRLRIIPALRYDAYELSTDADPLYVGARADQSDSRVSPKLGVVWQATPRFQLFANWAEGFKAPTPSQVNNGFSNAPAGYVSIPNPDLEPETSRSVEAGLRLRDIDFAGGAMAFQLVAFRSDYENFISQQVVSGAFTPQKPAVFQFVNFTDVEVKGLESRARIDWDSGWRLNLSGAWADGEQTTAGATTALPSIDPIKLVGGLGWDDPQGRFGAEVILTWSDAKKARDTDGLACFNAVPVNGCYVGDSFRLVDVTGYWNVTEQVTARIGVFNLFDETYSWWSDVRGVANTSAVVDAYTQPGRNVGLSLSLRL
ncbi:TonB-dependent hemoglobin/transferrin/lactoferrin family receptor [Brevundimonas bacteroides]|uniref:TonB-dependent hemoglobin/transferrin/lactoferrin family receptor n=1 Tax=Brevundimonas bacteroides TaxID=74311 RepID=UPI0004981DD9|nr:TonB-dependent hemoglobin/transferrin/lactoferrin family receptor [Brevundimonas bacteroides]